MKRTRMRAPNFEGIFRIGPKGQKWEKRQLVFVNDDALL